MRCRRQERTAGRAGLCQGRRPEKEWPRRVPWIRALTHNQQVVSEARDAREVAGVRADVAESWLRSAAAGVLADAVDAPITLPEDALRDQRAAHPLASVFPLLDDVLGRAARECDTDHGGVGRVRAAAVGVRHAVGPTQGRGHRIRRGQQLGRTSRRAPTLRAWRCASTNPCTSSEPSTSVAPCIAGAVRPRRSTTRPTRACSASSTSPVRTTSSFRRRGPWSGPRLGWPSPSWPGSCSRGMRPPAERSTRDGRPDSLCGSRPSGGRQRLLTVEDGRGHRRTIRLSPRHSEILLLLASAPRGLSGDELAVLLYEEDSSASTLRVELGRLRAILGDDLLASRPYRLVAERRGPTGSPSRPCSRSET